MSGKASGAWLQLLADCAQALREGFPKQALKLADQAQQLADANPGMVNDETSTWGNAA